MPSYDFRVLNDKEFEVLAADLLSEELQVRIERFKPGRDSGVDGRWFASSNREVVVQCKHWARTGYAGLLRYLRTKERAKVRKLRPSRYVLVTSLSLSRQNKKEIAKLFAPFMLAESDVFGQEDLNDLLGRHLSVELRHYKLWLASSNTLGLILNNAIVGRSRAALQEMLAEAALYVRTSDFTRAMKQLNSRRVLLLTGEPGVGKTTLAHQAVIELVADNYQLVVLEEDISEAESVYVETAKQVFYFDDFLGRTYLEALKAKQDSHVVSFIKRVARDASKRFVLTSRTNILNQGAFLSELLSDGSIIKNTYELKIGSLTPLERARILYNHIWHSRLTEAFIAELYSDKRYHRVIAHQNFNPRLIAFVLDDDKLGALLASEYWSYVEKTLANPEAVWSHFFDAQLSAESRDLVFIAVLHGGAIPEADLRQTFSSLPGRSTINAAETYAKFSRALHHAAGSVLNRSLNARSGSVAYTLFNPSIADYSLRFLASSKLLTFYFPHIRTVSALSQLEQMQQEPWLGVSGFREVLLAVAEVHALPDAPVDLFSGRLARLLATIPTLKAQFREFIANWLRTADETLIDSAPSDYVLTLVAANGVLPEDEMDQLFTSFASMLEAGSVTVTESQILRRLVEWADSRHLDEASVSLRAGTLAAWQDYVDEFVRRQNILSEFLDFAEADAAEAVVVSAVRDALAESGFNLTAEEAREIARHTDVSAVINDNIDVASHEDDESDRWREERQAANDLTAAIDDIFERTSFDV
jgi:adenylate kinase family enzyme